MTKKKSEGREGASSTFKMGTFALVFLLIGYQTALLVYRASVSAIVRVKAVPDTVYVERYVAVPDSVSPPPLSQTPATRVRTGGQAESKITRKFAPRKTESFRFDPNIVSVEDLQRLGFTPAQAESIDNYRKKGGRFRRKTDFAKSFVVSDSVYERLEPFIDIPLVDLNSADSAAFDALPGIGPFYAARMVSYRQELGGYSYPEQLMDIWKFDRERFDALKDLITVSKPYRYPLWELPEDSLRTHPYIDSHAARSIIIFKNNSPREEWTVEKMVEAGAISREKGLKLAPCVDGLL